MDLHFLSYRRLIVCSALMSNLIHGMFRDLCETTFVCSGACLSISLVKHGYTDRLDHREVMQDLLTILTTKCRCQICLARCSLICDMSIEPLLLVASWYLLSSVQQNDQISDQQHALY